MDSAGQTEFRSVIGKLTSLAHTSRPDICFDIKILSSKFGRATKTARKRMIKVKGEYTSMRFPDLEKEMDDWVL